MISRQQAGQARGGGALHRTEGKVPARFPGTRHIQRLIAQAEDALGIIQEIVAHRRQSNTLLLTDKQVNANLFFQLAQTSGEIGGHAMQQLCGARQRTGFGHRTEHAELY